MKTSTVVLVGLGVAAAGAAVYFATRPKKVVGSTSTSSAVGTAIAAFIPQATGALFDYFNKPSAPSNTAVSSGVSNYLADSTAKSDSETGVVGFGGWD